MRLSHFLTAALLSAAVTAKAAGDWQTDFAAAVAEANGNDKYLLLDFSGSDWCGWCKKLEREVFSQAEFRKFAQEQLVLVLLDFPKLTKISKKLQAQNEQLAAKYGIRGFPTVIILSPDGRLVGRTGYKRGGPENYVKELRQLISRYEAAQR